MPDVEAGGTHQGGQGDDRSQAATNSAKTGWMSGAPSVPRQVTRWPIAAMALARNSGRQSPGFSRKLSRRFRAASAPAEVPCARRPKLAFVRRIEVWYHAGLRPHVFPYFLGLQGS